MKKMKRILALTLAVSLLTLWNLPCYASDNGFKDTFENAFYGGLAGTLVGAALLAFTHKPEDHLDYMVYGAAGGVLLGATFGIVKSTRALAEYENGKVKFAIPTVIPELRENAATGQASLAFNAQLVRGSF
ncbi:MAG: hypothetical protein HZC44_03220 [Geobacter sp.]|nr:hypothetical protein [Geobacter sp.]